MLGGQEHSGYGPRPSRTAKEAASRRHSGTRASVCALTLHHPGGRHGHSEESKSRQAGAQRRGIGAYLGRFHECRLCDCASSGVQSVLRLSTNRSRAPSGRVGSRMKLVLAVAAILLIVATWRGNRSRDEEIENIRRSFSACADQFIELREIGDCVSAQLETRGPYVYSIQSKSLNIRNFLMPKVPPGASDVFLDCSPLPQPHCTP